jgi:GDP-4-dehydro-6-deoxy-D-mannose reductase
MTSLVISGVSGFVGAVLMRRLRAEGRHNALGISSSDGDVSNASTWATLPDADVVVHLAARTFVPDSWSDPAAFLHTNLGGTARALEYCRARGARLVFLSSYLYGNPKHLPINEEAEISVPNPYALSKKLAEDTCRFYAESFDIDVTVLRVFNIYGGGQGDKFLVPLIVRQVLAGSEVRVKDLEPRRDFLYIEDLADAIIRAIERPQRFGLFNIASGTSYSVQDVIDVAQRLAGRQVAVHSEQVRRQNEIMDTCGDISRAREQLGWTPRWSLEDGVAELLRSGV